MRSIFPARKGQARRVLQWLSRAFVVAVAFGPLTFGTTAAAAPTARGDAHQQLKRQPTQPLPLATEIAHSASRVAENMDTVGWCYAGVKQALNSVGVALSGAAAWMAAGQLEEDHRFAVVKQTDLHTGDILVHGKSATHPYGHICVYLGHGQEASDHIQHLILNGSYGRTLVFRPTGTTPNRIRTSVVVATTDAAKRAFARRYHTWADHSSADHSSPVAIASGRVSQPARAPGSVTVAQVGQPPAPTATEIAQAKHEADMYAYLYDQGCVSRNQATAKMQAWKALQPSGGDKLASSR